MEDKKIEDLDNSIETQDLGNLRGVRSEFEEKLKEIDSAREEKNKEKEAKPFKINIVDISKNKEKNKKFDIPFKKEFIKIPDSASEKLFEPLIYLGAGFLTFTKVTTNALSDFGTFVIKNTNNSEK
ncbi:MAG: hypothetical protein U0457_18750 [Candidatus Sericytochromatia bacterium]